MKDTLMPNHRTSCVLLLLTTAASVNGQTKIDLSGQGRNIDFSTATFTKPAKSGILLPVLCSPGELFFKLDASPGSNLYACTAVNVWSLLSGGAGTSFSFG